MNWKPIKDAPKDGTIIDLWCNGKRVENCKRDILNTAWVEVRFGIGGYENNYPLSGNITHYAEITPPQEPLPWPTENGQWWVLFPGDAEAACHTIRMYSAGFYIDGIFFENEKLVGCKFIRATPPTF